MNGKGIYMDNHATTPLDPRVLEAMMPYFTETFGNAASRSHGYGWEAEKAAETGRERIARLINAKAKEIIFTSGATESDNLAIKGVVEFYKDKGNHVITAAIEHKAVLDTCKALERKDLATVTYLPVDRDGLVDPDDVRKAITDKTLLVSIMFANNEIGTINPIGEIGKVTREKGVLFHTDATQGVGKLPLDVEAMNIDLLSMSAHKLHGPKGVGVLYVRKGTMLRPLLYGGHHERDRRPGTENVPGIVALGKAAELALNGLAEEPARVAALRDRLEEGILRKIPLAAVNGDSKRRLPTTTSIRFDYIEGEGFVIAMDLRGIACSTGAACSSGSLEPSHVLSAVGLTPDQARSSIRFSLSRFNTLEEIDHTIEVLPAVVEQLRSVSPHYRSPAVALKG